MKMSLFSFNSNKISLKVEKCITSHDDLDIVNYSWLKTNLLIDLYISQMKCF